MKVLVTGGTGRVGSELVGALQKKGASVRVLTRDRDKDAKTAPVGAEVAVGDLLNPESVRSALNGVDKMFLLVGNVADELTQALLTYAVAREAKIKHVTYLSVYQAERFQDVPHFIAKQAVETALKAFEVPFTILRPGYFFQNDLNLKDLLIGPGLFPTPIGTAGIAAVDVRDIAEAAAISLTTDGHAGKTYNLVTHSALSGPGAAAVWTKALGKPVNYPGVPVEAFGATAPSVHAALVCDGSQAHVPAVSGTGIRPGHCGCRRARETARPCSEALRGLRSGSRRRVAEKLANTSTGRYERKKQ